MASDLVFLDSAKANLEEVFEFISGFSPKAARKYVNGLEEACNRLRLFPQSGRVANSKNRVIRYRNHLIYYRWNREADVVEITLILDGRRDLSQV